MMQIGDPRVPGHVWAKTQEAPGPLKTPCWTHTGKLTDKGYTRVSIGGRMTMMHAFVLKVLGLLEAGMEPDHLCRIRACFNPLHLEAVTHAENMRRSDAYWAKRTHCPAGHPYDEQNTLVSKQVSGTVNRQCRTCTRDRMRRIRRDRKMEREQRNQQV